MAALVIPAARFAPASRTRLAGVAWALFGLAACSKFGFGRDEMSWARAALERNERLEVVAADQQTSTFTVRLKDTGELRMIRADQVIAGPPLAAGAAPVAKAVTLAASSVETPAAPMAEAATPSDPNVAPGTANAGSGSLAVPGEQARVASDEPAPAARPASALEPHSAAGSDATGGRVLVSGPGYSIKASGATGSGATESGGIIRTVARETSRAAVERRHEPIICQGDRLLQIDNRNFEFDGDAVSAENGCEIHITNSRIAAKGVGVSARSANVHITNSQIEGESGSIDASGGAQVYAESSTFKGLSRRLDNAAFHDLGGNVWN